MMLDERRNAARIDAERSVVRWSGQRADLLTKYEQAVDAVRDLVIAGNEHALDIAGTIADLEREQGEVGPIPQVRIERHASSVVVNGTRAASTSARFLVAEAVWEALTSGGLGADPLTKAALIEASIDIHRDDDGHDRVSSPSRRLRAELDQQ